jgi:hypothetical protein
MQSFTHHGRPIGKDAASFFGRACVFSFVFSREVKLSAIRNGEQRLKSHSASLRG